MYVDLVEQEGGTVLCGGVKDDPLLLPEVNQNVCNGFFYSSLSVLSL